MDAPDHANLPPQAGDPSGPPDSDPPVEDLFQRVARDLEQRLQAGESVRVEDYTARFPELTNQPDQLVELLVNEYTLRQQVEPLNQEAFLNRFPAVASQLRRRLEDQPGYAPAPPPHPDRVGRYRIQRWLAAGAMGDVYLGHDTLLSRPVAIKLSQPQRGLGERPRVEAMAGARVTHPGVCPVYDYGQVDAGPFQGVSYLVMAYVEDARTLTAAFPPPLAPVHAVRLTADLARAVHAIHEQGVLHRDLKPQNILVNRHNQTLVCDFGLARLTRPDDTATLPGATLGTPAYMAPEQARGEPVEATCDVYSLGVILFQLVTGRLPDNGSALEVLERVRTRRTSLRGLLPPTTDPSLADIVDRATAPAPADRYETMLTFAEALAAWSHAGTGSPTLPLPSIHVPAVDPRAAPELLEHLRTWGWEASQDRIRKTILEESDPARRATLEAALHWIITERGLRAGASTGTSPVTEGLPPGPLAGWVAASTALAALRERDFPTVEACLRQADDQAEGDQALVATVAHLRATAHFHQGAVNRAWDELCTALKGFGPEHFGTGRVLDTLGMVAVSRLQWPAGRHFYNASLSLKEHFQDEAGLALTRGQLGRLALDLGDLEEAQKHFEAGIQHSQQTSDVRGEAQQRNHLGQVWLARGRPDLARPLLEQALRLAAGRYPLVEAFARKDLARVLVDERQVDEAFQECDHAERLFRARPFEEGVAHVTRVRGLGLARAGSPDQATPLLQRAARFFEDHGEGAEAARCLWDLGRVWRECQVGQAGKPDSATARQAGKPDLQARESQSGNWRALFATARTLALRSRRPLLTAAIEADAGPGLLLPALDWEERLTGGIVPFTGTVVAVALDDPTAGSEDLSVEWEWRQQLTLDLEQEWKAVDGLVEQVTGEGFLVRFTGPQHGARAVRGAFRMLDWLERFHRPHRVMGWPAWRVRVGIAAGPFCLGRTGLLERVERGLGGPAAVRARALRDRAAPNIPCCDDVIRQVLGDQREFLSRPSAGGWDVCPHSLRGR